MPVRREPEPLLGLLAHLELELREVDTPPATCANAVNCPLEALAQLHLADEEAALGTLSAQGRPMYTSRSTQAIIRSPRFRNSFFRLSKPRGQYARRCVEERIPVAPCRQRFELLGKLNARIAGLNDGSFAMDDQETPHAEAL